MISRLQLPCATHLGLLPDLQGCKAACKQTPLPVPLLCLAWIAAQVPRNVDSFLGYSMDGKNLILAGSWSLYWCKIPWRFIPCSLACPARLTQILQLFLCHLLHPNFSVFHLAYSLYILVLNWPTLAKITRILLRTGYATALFCTTSAGIWASGPLSLPLPTTEHWEPYWRHRECFWEDVVQFISTSVPVF